MEPFFPSEIILPATTWVTLITFFTLALNILHRPGGSVMSSRVGAERDQQFCPRLQHEPSHYSAVLQPVDVTDLRGGPVCPQWEWEGTKPGADLYSPLERQQGGLHPGQGDSSQYEGSHSGGESHARHYITKNDLSKIHTLL